MRGGDLTSDSRRFVGSAVVPRHFGAPLLVSPGRALLAPDLGTGYCPAYTESDLVLRPRVLARAYDHTRRYCTGQEARLVNGDLLLWTQALFGNSDFQK